MLHPRDLGSHLVSSTHLLDLLGDIFARFEEHSSVGSVEGVVSSVTIDLIAVNDGSVDHEKAMDLAT